MKESEIRNKDAQNKYYELVEKDAKVFFKISDFITVNPYMGMFLQGFHLPIIAYEDPYDFYQ